MDRKFNRFGRGSGAYRCLVCGKLTRDTGHDEATAQLCAKCNAEALAENHHSDECHEGPLADCLACQDLMRQLGG